MVKVAPKLKAIVASQWLTMKAHSVKNKKFAFLATLSRKLKDNEFNINQLENLIILFFCEMKSFEQHVNREIFVSKRVIARKSPNWETSDKIGRLDRPEEAVNTIFLSLLTWLDNGIESMSTECEVDAQIAVSQRQFDCNPLTRFLEDVS